MAKRFKFPKWLQRTEAELTEEGKVQELRRASFGRGHLTPEELLVGRGALLEETARGNLNAASGKNKEARILAQNQMADGLAMQGRFTEAAKLHTERHRRKFFRDVVKAIKRPDSEKCKCPDITGTVEGVDVTITPRFVAREVFSQKHGKVVSLVRCQTCGHTNAREPRSRLLTQNSASRQNIAAANGGGRGLMRDSQLLKVR